MEHEYLPLSRLVDAKYLHATWEKYALKRGQVRKEERGQVRKEEMEQVIKEENEQEEDTG